MNKVYENCGQKCQFGLIGHTCDDFLEVLELTSDERNKILQNTD